MTQKEALEIMKMGHSVFLTGAAGTGKTFVLNQYIHYLKSHSINPSITASTGIASTHINGATIHSYSGIGVIEKLDSYTLDKILQNEKLFKKYRDTKVLIIDEISMLHASKLDMVNTLFKKFLENSSPFAGRQVIFCGDFFQLPPVVKSSSFIELTSTQNEFAYNSNAWKELSPVICYLEENYRQEDESLLKILNGIRSQNNKKDICNELNKKSYNLPNKEILKLYTHNIDVDKINLDAYTKLDKNEDEYSYKMESSGKQNLVENLKKNCLAPEILNLKKGTKVIFIKNDKNKEYQNGTLGEVVDFEKDTPIIKTFSGKRILASADSWQLTNDDGKVLAEISQIPLRYAWAITVHKSQGMTLDAAEIDLSKAFGSSLGYVALSRVKRLANIRLLGVSEEALNIDSQVLKQDQIFKDRSKRAKQALLKYLDEENKPKKELIKKQNDFLESCGGNLSVEEVKEDKLEKPIKIKSSLLTLEFLKNQTPLSQIAEERKINVETVLSHIEELSKKKELLGVDMSYFFLELNKKFSNQDFKKIESVLKKNLSLKDTYQEINNKLKIKINYIDLKLLILKLI